MIRGPASSLAQPSPVRACTDTWPAAPLLPCRVTVAGVKGVGDSVNIEVEAQTQAIVDTVERVLQVRGKLWVGRWVGEVRCLRAVQGGAGPSGHDILQAAVDGPGCLLGSEHLGIWAGPGGQAQVDQC